jgi:cobalt/nickel transport system permease protein
MDLLSAGAAGVAARRVQQSVEPERVPVMGMAAAFVFAAQMINFPVAGGTSGHLMGGFLVARLLGPGPAMIVMTTIFAVQCLLFQDGGLTALGANVFNMGILGSLAGYAIFRALRALSAGEGTATAIAAWLSVMLGATACSLELALSGTVALRVVLPAMLAVHALIGVGEALITLGALALIRRARPELLVAVGG